MTSERLAEIKHNLEHAGRTHYRDVSDLLADNAALREALARIAGVLDDPRWDGTREDGPRAMLDWCISVARKANPLAAAAVREAKEQA